MTTETVDHLQDAADAGECDLDLTGRAHVPRLPDQAAGAAAGRRRARTAACGYEPRQILSGGASDANSFEAAGLPCTCLADGTERNHEPGERISAQSLEELLELAIALVDEAAAELER